jgi:hypothetical protein
MNNEKRTVIIKRSINFNAIPTLCVITAIYFMFTGVTGWGWLLFITLITL